MSGYPYNSPEPTRECPYCETLTWADFVDVGIGFEQVGPYHCDNCKAYEFVTHSVARKTYRESCGVFDK